jgi:hypothetical protein
MAVKEQRVNFRVEVEIIPESARWSSTPRTERQSYDAANELAATTRRRLDGDECGTISVNSDLERTCEFCGRKWTEDSETYNGGCCNVDEDTEEAREAAAIVAKESV